MDLVLQVWVQLQAVRAAWPGDQLEGGAVSFEDFREDVRRRMGVNGTYQGSCPLGVLS